LGSDQEEGKRFILYYLPDAIIMRWNKDKYQIAEPLDNRKHRNMGVVRSASDKKQYLTSCQAIDQEFTTLAYPATICMECQAAEVTEVEASVEAPKASQNKPEKTMDGVRPVMPTEIERMREEIFKGKESETILQDDDITVEEDFPTYAQDSQEYMHWHYRLNHPTHTVMTKMAKQGMLPRGITKILTTMSKQYTSHQCVMTVVEPKQQENPREVKARSINKEPGRKHHIQEK
jgi:hypothetical protein